MKTRFRTCLAGIDAWTLWAFNAPARLSSRRAR